MLSSESPAVSRNRFSWYVLIFSAAFGLFFVGPPLLGKPFRLYPLMKIADVVDLVTPLVLIPLYWLLFRLDGSNRPGLKESLVFLLLAAFWVEGQGMHLSANSIGHWLTGIEGSDGYNLAKFYDEKLSHLFWHFGVVALSASLMVRQWRNPFSEAGPAPWPLVGGAIIYGLTYFLIVVEGGTTPLGLPFAVLTVLFGLTLGRRRLKRQPVLHFFVIAHGVATGLFIMWGIYWRGFPEFSEVGIIN